MCYDLDARPPVPPISGGSANGEDIVLTAQDGTRFAAYLAHPTQKKNAQVIVFPDVRGLHQFYKELALRFAEQGYPALALDYFGRTAGIGPRDDTFEFRSHVEAMTMPTFLTDVTAALAYLRANNPAVRATFVVGFCRGGALSLLTATEALDLSGIIAFYAGMSRPIPGARGATLDQASQIRYPVLGLFGGADQGIPASDVQQLDAQLDRAGVPHEIVTYPDAPHSFFDRRYTEFADASADAWTRALNFIAAHTQAS
ncbi:MAG: dienelactone hydrolase family protein [Chloroflexi bacterium]|nr:dienelactone hydrolase family protein [Chloroflexota bacterium]